MLRGIVMVTPDAWWSAVPQFLPFTALDGLVPRDRGTGAFLSTAGTVGPALAAVIGAGYLAVIALFALRALARSGSVRGAAAVA